MHSIEEICQDIRDGKMVVIADDIARENEGDLVMSASMVTAEHINFMATHARGLICLTMTDEQCKNLDLSLMVGNNTALHKTNFTVSIDAATNITTGISAADRAHTILQAVAPHAKPTDIVQPGHIFPLRAEKGGVLSRAGHTEAGCDLAQIAGMVPAAVIVEIMNPDGTMARKDDLIQFAKTHNLKMGYIADLIHYRFKHERTVKCVAQENIQTVHGDFELRTYKDCERQYYHHALVRGEISRSVATPVRVHTHNPLLDTLSLKQDKWSRWEAQKYIGKNGGILVLLSSNIDLETSLSYRASTYIPDTHQVGVGAQILRDIGAEKMRVLGSQTQYSSLSGFGLEIVDYIAP